MFPEHMFRQYLQAHLREFQDEHGLWKLKGFIDLAHRVYSLNTDTKVISKALELMLAPFLFEFAKGHGYTIHSAPEQNFYPDYSLVAGQERIALDLKTTYRLPTNPTRVSGFTLGAFTGYFRSRGSNKNVGFPYGEYAKHYVVGVIYSKTTAAIEPTIYALEQLHEIPTPIFDLEVIVAEKWRVAGDMPGSGNTKNIGSIKTIEGLRRESGPFMALGDEGASVFDAYWSEYMTSDMARAAQLPKPLFKNLRQYLAYRNRPDLLARLEQAGLDD
ncbi:MAG: restriction endonuclease [Chloroflexi bacterium]|nr:restriction endonuclease [Chloroflexota bacterium]